MTPQSVRGTTILTPPSVTPAQHIQQQIHAGSSAGVTVLHHHQQQHQHLQQMQQQQQQHQQQLQQQLQQQQQQQLQQQQQISQTEAEADQEHEEVSLVVGEVYEDENGQPVVINEDGTITPVSVQHVEAPAEQQQATEQDLKVFIETRILYNYQDNNDHQNYSIISSFYGCNSSSSFYLSISVSVISVGISLSRSHGAIARKFGGFSFFRNKSFLLESFDPFRA